MTQTFRFGVIGWIDGTRAEWAMQARIIEELGYASLLVNDRIFLNAAPFVALSYAAEATSGLKLGTFVCNNDLRHPLVLAQDIATLQHLSHGRLELGLGIGAGTVDQDALGLPKESVGARLEKLEEAFQLLHLSFTEEQVTFSGNHYQVTNVPGYARQQLTLPPIFMGCSGDRMLSIAAKYAQSVGINARFVGRGPDPLDSTPEAQLKKIAHLKEQAANAGRSEAIELGHPIYDLEIVDSPARYLPVPGMSMPRRVVTIREAIDYLLAEHDRFGYTYFQINQGQIHNFYPVLRHLQNL